MMLYGLESDKQPELKGFAFKLLLRDTVAVCGCGRYVFLLKFSLEFPYKSNKLILKA